MTPSVSFSADDQRFMARAIQLAEKGRYTTRPNPRVGCVIVMSGETLAEGWHYRAGEAHAEVHALSQLDVVDDAQGATVYVTLEPCSHQGRTGPCAVALQRAGIARLVYGMKDPNPLVAGRGLAILEDGGVVVDGPLMEAPSAALNRGFIRRMQIGLPWVRCKLASSLDGRTAMENGESQWITGPEARRDVQKLRAQSCAVITGIGSIRHDDSRLSVRADELLLERTIVDDVIARPPLRVILDSSLSISEEAAILLQVDQQQKSPVIIFTHDDAPKTKEEQLLAGFPEHLTIRRIAYSDVDAHLGGDTPSSSGLDIVTVLTCLAKEYECNEVLLEAGATLSGAFLRNGLVNECIIYQAPLLLGSQARPLFQLPIEHMQDKVMLNITDQRALGQDWRITAELAV